MTVTELIVKIGRAADGSRELSDEVLLALGWIGPGATLRKAGILVPHWQAPDWWRPKAYGEYGLGSGGCWLEHQRPCPTTTIDGAAMLSTSVMALAGQPLWTVNVRYRDHGTRDVSCMAEITVPSREFLATATQRYAEARARTMAALSAYCGLVTKTGAAA